MADQQAPSRLWALDINGDGDPWRAHLIVEPSECPANGEWPDVLVTACGLRLTQGNHPRGWWSVPDGELPLAPYAVHCGAGS